MTASFHDQVIAILPKLRVQALALTRNRSVAEDLVQDTVCNALSAQDSFVMGTNFAAWMHRILRNRFISDLRKKREVANIDDTPQSLLSVSGRHEDRLALKELDAALARLPDDQREALVLGVLEGMSYQELADIAGCAVGTAKSRVFRARRQLEIWLIGEEDDVSGKTGTESASRMSSTRRKTRTARNTTRTAQQTA
ncbi:DNA-directed RNA polymerase sigma-70 factor [Acetobacter pomorum]|uniref:DNA-directed RNA polymerase sigma-70 factor n=1 Tax=Acetobacter pomorum TaxID=65959 RepID=A0A2G4RBJ1_9PROT|nr:sigma-70 family RNA polymerase sigma factor [Acetobacter pomorum]KDE20400.1 XRE family transcriptional regulator [Acetobacter aceti 1023]PHY93880.1 DNA-directed RNA polymerase sigma-70 factor [Acetobacter pomorum]GBR53963.1 DNA-directed RNA polymerase sigma-E/Sigma-24/FecI [Acetobacter pomorum DSM 11825]